MVMIEVKIFVFYLSKFNGRWIYKVLYNLILEWIGIRGEGVIGGIILIRR